MFNPASNKRENVPLMKLLTLNARSLCNKLHLFDSYVKELSPDFITVTETWAHPKLTDAVF